MTPSRICGCPCQTNRVPLPNTACNSPMSPCLRAWCRCCTCIKQENTPSNALRTPVVQPCTRQCCSSWRRPNPSSKQPLRHEGNSSPTTQSLGKQRPWLVPSPCPAVGPKTLPLGSQKPVCRRQKQCFQHSSPHIAMLGEHEADRACIWSTHWQAT